MSWHPQHKEATRKKILHSAAQLFAEKGFQKVSIDQVMKDAGLTRGCFYAHFKSKSVLYQQALKHAAMTSAASRLDQQGAGLEQLVNGYLNVLHRQGDSHRCSLAFLVTDIVQRDAHVRDTYTDVFRGFSRIIQRRMDLGEPCESEQGDCLTPHALDEARGGVSEKVEGTEVSAAALEKAVLLIGGLAISRAINDDSLAEDLLSICRQSALKTAVL